MVLIKLHHLSLSIQYYRTPCKSPSVVSGLQMECTQSHDFFTVLTLSNQPQARTQNCSTGYSLDQYAMLPHILHNTPTRMMNILVYNVSAIKTPVQKIFINEYRYWCFQS